MLLPVSCQETKTERWNIFVFRVQPHFYKQDVFAVKRSYENLDDKERVLFKEAVKSLFLYVKRVNYE